MIDKTSSLNHCGHAGWERSKICRWCERGRLPDWPCSCVFTCPTCGEVIKPPADATRGKL